MAQCTNYQGLGIDFYNGCFTKVDPSSTDQFGTDASDPNFIQDCVNLVNCSFAKNCGYGDEGASGCFCGTATLDACFATAGAANGPCMAEVQAAARSTSLSDISTRASDLAYPFGWATYLLECDAVACKDPAGGKCTP